MTGNGRPSILKVEDLVTRFNTPEGTVFAVNGVSFELGEGETLGVVGESGCGKSVTMLSVLQLIPRPPGVIANGRALFHGNDLLHMTNDEIRTVRGAQIAMIFQDPMTSLNPVLNIGKQVSEPLILHLGMNKKEADERVVELLRLVGIPEAEKRLTQYPHQFSGGMRQRVMIAMALACNPQILIADEPTTALDVTTQAQILCLMNDLKEETGTSIILVTHDLGIVAQVCQDVAVMYTGHIVEYAPVGDIFSNALHPYTKGLMRSVPTVRVRSRMETLYAIPGTVPTFKDMPKGCTFNNRCPEVMDICRSEYPGVFHAAPDHTVRCWRYRGT